MSPDTHGICDGIRFAGGRCPNATQLHIPRFWRHVCAVNLARKLCEPDHSVNLLCCILARQVDQTRLENRAPIGPFLVGYVTLRAANPDAKRETGNRSWDDLPKFSRLPVRSPQSRDRRAACLK